MSAEIQIYSNKASGLTIEERECFIALQGQKIKDYKIAELEDELNKILQTTYFNCGQVLSSEDAIPVLDSIVPDIKNYFSSLTIEEVKVAFKRGLLKDYGDYFGLNPKTFLGWLKSYMASANRAEVKTKIKMHNEEQLTEEEKEKIVVDGVYKCWEEFKEKGVVYDFGNATYNYLDRKGIIPFTVERKWQIYREVKERLISQAKEKRAKVKDVLDKRNFDELIYALTSETGNEKDTLKFESRREALKIFFTDLLEMGEDLKELIKTNKYEKPKSSKSRL